MVRFQGLTAAALGAILSALVQELSVKHVVFPPRRLLQSMEADLVVPFRPKPVMD